MASSSSEGSGYFDLKNSIALGRLKAPIDFPSSLSLISTVSAYSSFLPTQSM
jgi:hypothetical protein